MNPRREVSKRLRLVTACVCTLWPLAVWASWIAAYVATTKQGYAPTGDTMFAWAPLLITWLAAIPMLVLVILAACLFIPRLPRAAVLTLTILTLLANLGLIALMYGVTFAAMQGTEPTDGFPTQSIPIFATCMLLVCIPALAPAVNIIQLAKPLSRPNL